MARPMASIVSNGDAIVAGIIAVLAGLVTGNVENLGQIAYCAICRSLTSSVREGRHHISFSHEFIMNDVCDDITSTAIGAFVHRRPTECNPVGVDRVEGNWKSIKYFRASVLRSESTQPQTR